MADRRGLTLVRLTKTLDVIFRNYLGIMLMVLMVDDVEKEWLCHTVDFYFIITDV